MSCWSVSYEPDTGLLRRVTGVGIAPETMAELMARKQPFASLSQLMKPEFKDRPFLLHPCR